MTSNIDDEEIIHQVVTKMVEKTPAIPRTELEAIVREELTALAGRPVRDYLSVLTERAVKKRLKKARVEG